MSLYKAKKAFKENGARFLSAKDGAAWNTNAGLLNLVEGLEAEFAQIHEELAHLSKQIAGIQR